MNSNQKWNNDKCWCECKNKKKHKFVKKIIFGILLHVVVKLVYFYVLLAFLLIIISLLVAVNIYCYLINCQAKQKCLLPYDIANNKLEENLY